MTNKEAILGTVNFIEDNLASGISVADMASHACCSLHHFIRLFKHITGFSPKQYLLRRRLAESLPLLKDTDEKVLDIAYRFQFGSNEVFTRAFQKHFGTTPSAFRKGHEVPLQMVVHAITEAYLGQSKKTRNESPSLIAIKEKTLVGVSYYFDGNLDELELSKEWSGLMAIAGLIKNKIEPAHYFQVQYWNESQPQEGMHFFMGVEVNSIKEVSPQFVVKIIPQGNYLIFTHKGLSKDVGLAYRYIYQEYLPDTDFVLDKPFNFELYGDKYLSPFNKKSESQLFIPVSR